MKTYKINVKVWINIEDLKNIAKYFLNFNINLLINYRKNNLLENSKSLT